MYACVVCVKCVCLCVSVCVCVVNTGIVFICPCGNDVSMQIPMLFSRKMVDTNTLVHYIVYKKCTTCRQLNDYHSSQFYFEAYCSIHCTIISLIIGLFSASFSQLTNLKNNYVMS